MLMAGFGIMPTNQLATLPCLLTNAAAMMTGASRYYRKVGKEVKLVAFIGDGATGDAGFQALSGAAERQENLIYICYDNEAYMLTGIQRSGATPSGAWTTTTPVGQMRHGTEQISKYLPLLLAFHGIPYVATAAVSDLEDYFQKLEKAMKVKDGMAYIHLFSPCMVGWRAPMDKGIEISELAVETNYFPLWEAERGKFRLNKEVKNPKPISEFTKSMRRFSHLKSEDMEALQEAANARLHLIKALANSTASQ
jgi:pyruvate/2-oxoacid:ferredoxin oxidoreductase beta subunit